MGKRQRRKHKKPTDEVLHSEVRMDGSGEDPIVQVFLDEIATATHERSFEIMTLLQQHLKGEPMDIQDPALRDKIFKSRARAVAMDKVERRFEEDPVKFVEDITTESRKLHPTKAHLERDKAKGAKMYENAQTMARSVQQTKRLELMYRLKNDPKEIFLVRGTTMMVGSQENAAFKQFDEEIHFDGLDTIYIRPGQRSIPAVLAEVLRVRYRDQDEGAARDAAFAAYKPDDELQKELADIDREYGGRTDRLPVAPISV